VGGPRSKAAMPDAPRHFEGLTHRGIAERLKLPAGTVKSRSFRAHKRLTAQLVQLRA
jgi:DNA-directed RNA polymerase specialized sigma24 family protein